MTDYHILDVQQSEDLHYVTVQLQTGNAKTAKLHFQLARKDIGRKKNSLMTKSLKKEV